MRYRYPSLQFILIFSIFVANTALSMDSQENGDSIPTSMRMPEKGQIEFLQKLLKASPSQLRAMRKTIERVESMSAEQRKAMHLRLHQFRNATPEEKQIVFTRLKQRMRILDEHFKGLSEKEKENELKYFQSLKETDRSNYIKKIRQKINGGRPSK